MKRDTLLRGGRGENRSHWHNETRMNRGNTAWKAANLVETQPRCSLQGLRWRCCSMTGRSCRRPGVEIAKGVFPHLVSSLRLAPRDTDKPLAPAGTTPKPWDFILAYRCCGYYRIEEKTTYKYKIYVCSEWYTCIGVCTTRERKEKIDFFMISVKFFFSFLLTCRR